MTNSVGKALSGKILEPMLGSLAQAECSIVLVLAWHLTSNPSAWEVETGSKLSD